MDFGALQCTPQSPDCTSCPLSETCLGYATGRVAKLPVKKYKVKSRDRFLNYIYVRVGAYTFISKRALNDIWQNLFEFPLIETATAVSEDEFLSLADFQAMLAPGEEPLIRCVCRNVKHVLSHQVIYANFYEVTLPEESVSFSRYQKIRVNELEQYAVSRLIHTFIEKYIS